MKKLENERLVDRGYIRLYLLSQKYQKKAEDLVFEFMSNRLMTH